MRIDFESNGFSANMDEPDHRSSPVSRWNGNLLNRCTSLIFGILAMVFAFIQIPFGFFINVSTDLLREALGNNLYHYLFMLSMFVLIALLLSVTCAVISIITYKKSAKHNVDTVGLVFSIMSLTLCVIGLVFNIAGMFLW